MTMTEEPATPATGGKLPQRLSPSRMSDFKKCPKAFWFKSVQRIATKPTEAQIKGTLVHAVLEHLFDLPRSERTVEAAVAMLPVEWDKLRGEEIYAELVAGLDEASFLAEAHQLVVNYFAMEDPTGFDPDGREMWVRGEVDGQSLIGVIDRLDRVARPDGTTTVFVSDYKTGKVPKERYRKDAFFAMRVYALMLAQAGERVDRLRLVYVKEGHRDAVLRLDIDEPTLRRTESEVSVIIKGIRDCHEADQWPTRTGPLCPWCDYQEICPEFAGKVTVSADPAERVSPW